MLKIPSFHHFRAMSTSFKSLSGPFNWVNNQRVEPLDSYGKISNLEPRSGKLLAEVATSGKKEVDRAVQAAKEAFQSWSKVKTSFIRCNMMLQYLSLKFLAKWYRKRQNSSRHCQARH